MNTTDQQAVTVPQEAAEAWRIPSNADGTGELVRPKDDCVFGYKHGYLAGLASVSSASAEGLFDRRPQTSAIENGPEPSLRQMVRFYYGQHGQVDPDADAAAYLAAFAASPEPVPATNQAGEVERLREALEKAQGAFLTIYAGLRGDRPTNKLNAAKGIAFEHMNIVDAALATQPATSQEPDGWLAVKVNSEGGIVMPYGPLHPHPDRPNDPRYQWAPFYLGEPK